MRWMQWQLDHEDELLNLEGLDKFFKKDSQTYLRIKRMQEQREAMHSIDKVASLNK